ncbi:hypothetical protein CSHISOI_09729 [Colletotrichum shisoi]|uniref:Uncharacterized protein n=1 Tax=Colletotrichum shisoi TaxID=2078593 RepID=A0A5Q4BFK2_9PEZI|nr:hypothetical protein CSHISOI_09729 [Colletotrichum shisoi]
MANIQRLIFDIDGNEFDQCHGRSAARRSTRPIASVLEVRTVVAPKPWQRPAFYDSSYWHWHLRRQAVMNHQTRAMRSDHYRQHEVAHIRGVCPSLASLGCSRAQHQTDLDHG